MTMPDSIKNPPEVVRDPGIMSGVACFAGSRLPVENIVASLEHGCSKEELIESWPFLTEAHFEVAIAYMRSHPRRSVPRRIPELNPDLILRESKRFGPGEE